MVPSGGSDLLAVILYSFEILVQYSAHYNEYFLKFSRGNGDQSTSSGNLSWSQKMYLDIFFQKMEIVVSLILFFYTTSWI